MWTIPASLIPWFSCIGTAIIAIGTVVIAVSIVFLRGQLKSAEKDRHSDLLMRFSERWESPWLREGREAIWKINQAKQNLGKTIDSYKKTNVPEMLKLTSVGDFFEDIGFLARHDYIKPLELIDALFGPSIEEYHKLYSSFIKKHKAKEIYDNFDWLANKLKKKS